ncbi:hypothetical protein ABPG77_001097 [Micractinium sp. CCAP 211/92]
MKGQARGRPGAAASLPNPGAAATAASPAASVGAASAKTAYQQYVKGKRREGLEVLKRAHEESPSAATCLLGAKLHVLEAAEAAFKDDAGDEARENAVLLHLHLAMVLAAEGAMDHRSLTCLHLLTFLLHCTEGRPGWDERRSIHECVGEALFPGELYASEDCEPRRATAHPWLGFASEVPGLDKWQFEDIGSRASQQQVVKKVCKGVLPPGAVQPPLRQRGQGNRRRRLCHGIRGRLEALGNPRRRSQWRRFACCPPS